MPKKVAGIFMVLSTLLHLSAALQIEIFISLSPLFFLDKLENNPFAIKKTEQLNINLLLRKKGDVLMRRLGIIAHHIPLN